MPSIILAAVCVLAMSCFFLCRLAKGELINNDNCDFLRESIYIMEEKRVCDDKDLQCKGLSATEELILETLKRWHSRAQCHQQQPEKKEDGRK